MRLEGLVAVPDDLAPHGAGVFREHRAGMKNAPDLEVFRMLWTIIGILIVLWLLGLLFNIGGNLIYALLVIAAIVFVVQLISGRRAV